MRKIKTIFICVQFLCVFLFAFSAGAQETEKDQKTSKSQTAKKTGDAKITVEVVATPADLKALMKRNTERLRYRRGKGHKPGDSADEKKEKGPGKDGKGIEKNSQKGMEKKNLDKKKKLHNRKKAGAKEKYKKHDKREKRRMQKKYMDQKDGERRMSDKTP